MVSYKTLLEALLPHLFRLVKRVPLPGRVKKSALAVLFELRALYDENGGWWHFVDTLDGGHFSDDGALALEEKKRIFKAAVRLVEFEPHAFCNRKCAFCPNLFLNRTEDRTAFDFDCFKSVLLDLKEIGYDKNIRFARYSEPLASEKIVDFVALTREELPKARIEIISNGDYLTRKLLDRLAVAGLDLLHLSIYPKGDVWDQGNAHEQLAKISRRIEIDPEIVSQDSQSIVWTIPFDGIGISARAIDFGSVGYDRGKTMGDLIDHKFHRRSPCPFVFNNVTVDFTGTVMPCCNLLADVPEHQPFIVDRLGEGKSIFDIYFSKELTAWRRGLVGVGEKAPPCDTCKQNSFKSRLPLFFLKKEVNARLGTMGRRPPGR